MRRAWWGLGVVSAAWVVGSGCGEKAKDPAVPAPTAEASAVPIGISSAPPPPAGAASGAAAPAPADDGRMVEIPLGDFDMGSADGDADEKPVRRVHVNAFSMDVTEVTAGAYQACVKADGCLAADTRESCNYGRAERSSHPINCVSWLDAGAYCAWAGKRLPTEEEWEYAARGAEGRRYPWGSDAPGAQLCWDRGDRGTCAVGSFPAGVFGLRDMAGNVWEWTSSRWSSDRVMRGGSWSSSDPAWVRGSYRSRARPSVRFLHVGFRCAR